MLTYDQQIELVNRKLATKSVNEELQLVTFKYSKKVMFDYLWDDHPELMYCRGHTYDIQTKQLVLRAPKKTFNFGEDDKYIDLPKDTKISIFKKFNGFMATAAKYNNKLIVGTTGSTKSDFAVLARTHIEKLLSESPELNDVLALGGTMLFEICDPTDPHIVSEPYGAHVLGHIAVEDTLPFGVPKVVTLTELQQMQSDFSNKIEGWMGYVENADGLCIKFKTDYYVGKKKLMRMKPKHVKMMYSQSLPLIESLHPEWQAVVRKITSQIDMQKWLTIDEQQRRLVLESFESN